MKINDFLTLRQFYCYTFFDENIEEDKVAANKFKRTLTGISKQSHEVESYVFGINDLNSSVLNIYFACNDSRFIQSLILAEGSILRCGNFSSTYMFEDKTFKLHCHDIPKEKSIY